MEISASSISEAKEALSLARDAQKQLRGLKREVNQDMKAIRAEYRQKSANAASGTSAVLTIAGKKKLAGQARADAKRRLRRERDAVLKPYEDVKLVIDDMIDQLDGAKTQLQAFIDEIKAEEEAERERREAYRQSLLTLHLDTPRPDTELEFVEERFDVSKPIEPSGNVDYSTKPTPPILGEQDFLSKLFGPRRRRIEERNQEMLQKYEDRLARWQESIREAEEKLEADTRECNLRLQEWEEQKRLFEREQESRRRLIEEQRFADMDAMRTVLSERLNSIQWPIEGTDVSFQIQDDGEMVVVNVSFPAAEDWPVEGTSATQRRKDYVVHIHSIAFYLLGETFFVLPTVLTAILSGYVQRPSKSTGQLYDECLLSVEVSRSKWMQINFEYLSSIDVVECFDEFEVRRKITARGAISPVEPIQA
jgi:hypothetical protein